MSFIVRLFKEPLLHFIVAGSVLFAAYGWMAGSEPGVAMRQVRIGEGEVRWLTETWTRQWQRSPTRQELRGLVGELLKEELLAREARDLGLDSDDTVVRRRLAQKLSFLLDDTADLAAPTEEDLQRLYEAERERYREPSRISLTHLFFARERRADAASDAARVLAHLSQDAAPQPALDAADPFLIEPELLNEDKQAVAARFGADFAEAVFALAPGSWQGPVASGYGLHLVRVMQRSEPQQRSFEEVKPQLTTRWREEQRRQVQERYFADLMGKYEIVFDDKVEALVGPVSASLVPVR